MARAKITSNERSWAIELITAINSYSANHQRAICRAGGEYTLTGGETSLFPDVLLFGDQRYGLVLQGWELKMPDTPITDHQLIANAEKKARQLGLKSFVLWNVRQAVLYNRCDSGIFSPQCRWGPIEIQTRAAVAAGTQKWLGLLHQILDDLNDFFEQRPETATAVPEVLDCLFADLIARHSPTYAAALTTARRRQSKFRAQVDQWWMENRHDHPGLSETQALAEANILNWLNKLIFAHCLKRLRKEAFAVDDIVQGTTVAQTQEMLIKISKACNFMAVFQNMLGQEYVDQATWQSLLAANALLIGTRLDKVPSSLLEQTLEGTVERGRRKAFGQFLTPVPLADFLVRLAVDNIEGTILDPCCGAGTIARAAYQWKKSENIAPCTALGQIWASDKFTFPLQLATMALADPETIGTPLNIFCHDALTLVAGQDIPLTDPATGQCFMAPLPPADCIVSNLPFVRFETLGRQQGQSRGAAPGPRIPALDSKSDLFAHLIMNFPRLLRAGARVGVIVANSWLGTGWGREFRQHLGKRFHVRAVITSANGRWFGKGAVVTNILLLELRDSLAPENVDEGTNFITTLEPLDQWNKTGGGMAELAGQATYPAPAKSNRRLHVSNLTTRKIVEMENLGLQWTAFFANLDFMDAARSSLVPANSIFSINRGERRGWDKFFYPQSESGIEPKFLKPVVMNSKRHSGLIAGPDAQAFCCSLTPEDLIRKGCRGALAWINRYKLQTNGTGKPLPQVLRRPGCQWYEMKASALADFAIPINPDARLCVFRLKEQAFVNQRFIRLTLRDPPRIDAELLHALLNSTFGMFLIEAAGFGRGLGVLDLNATKLSKTFHILDPDRPDATAAARIKDYFRPLLARNIKELPEEIARPDRLDFDSCIAEVYGFVGLEQSIREALEFLYKVRKSARD